MKLKMPNTLLLAGLLIILSALVYFCHWLMFHDAHHIFIYLVGDIGFVFIEVLLVSLIIHRLLNEHQKNAILKKLNMVIGSFFSELGTPLLRDFTLFDQSTQAMTCHLCVDGRWEAKQFSEAKTFLESHAFDINSKAGDLEGLKVFLVSKRDFLLRLLENPNLLEHDSFSELLLAVFHLVEELAHRDRFDNLSGADYNHLSGDIKRAYVLLLREWICHMRHLKDDYPYLFSLAVRTNPYNPNAVVEIKESA